MANNVRGPGVTESKMDLMCQNTPSHVCMMYLGSSVGDGWRGSLSVNFISTKCRTRRLASTAAFSSRAEDVHTWADVGFENRIGRHAFRMHRNLILIKLPSYKLSRSLRSFQDV